MDKPSFRAGWHLRRCWRGPSWMNTAWLLVPALRRHGYVAEAERIEESCLELVERHGFREFFQQQPAVSPRSLGDRLQLGRPR